MEENQTENEKKEVLENGKAKPNMKAMKSIIEFTKLNNIDSSKIELLWND